MLTVPLTNAPAELASVLLNLSLAGTMLMRPIYAPDNATIIDLSLVHLNPAAQQMLGLPECPAESFLTLYPTAESVGVFGFYRDAFLSGQVERRQNSYLHDGLDGYYTLVAQRCGEWLVVSFTDTNDQPRSVLEEALRESRAQEQAARAEAETERQRLQDVLMQLPAHVAVQHGPDHVFTLANPAYQRVAQGRELLGRPIREAWPELAGTGDILDMLDEVYRTGKPFRGTEVPLLVDFTRTGQLEQAYYNVFFLPLHDAGGQVYGVLDFSYDVTEQVRSRQQVEQLNQELEARVLARTQQLDEQQQLLQRMFEQAPVPIFVLRGPQYIVDVVNPAMSEMLGQSVAALLGRPYLEAVPELASQGYAELLAQVWQTGQAVTVQESPARLARHQPGETGYFTFVYQPLQSADSQPMAIMCVAVEVTEQVLARQRIEESAQQVRDLVEGVPLPIGMYAGPDFRIQLANQAMLAALGKGQDVIGQRFIDVLPELENQGLIQQLQQVQTTGHALHLRGQRLDMMMAGHPQTFYYNYSFTPLRDSQGRVHSVLNTAADVTDLVLVRQRLEANTTELLESEARFRTLADAAPNIVWDLNPEGAVRYVNKFFLNFLGISMEKFVADNWGPYLLPEDVLPTQQILSKAISERVIFSMEHRMRRHDGQYRWLLTQGGPSYYSTGELYGYVGSAIDITDLKQANEQLRRTNADLDNFIYTASHDLKAPISNIEGLLLALEHELPTAGRVGDVPMMLDLMQGAVERFKRTIGHLTDISRLQKEHDQPREQVQLAAVVEEVRLDLMPLLRETQAQLAIAVPADLTLTFSAKNLRSVVYNLLSNALKYRHPDRTPEVRLSCQPQDGYQVLAVQDNGLGLDLAQGQQQLFAMFQRLHTHVEGTGVGLYMVKKMVENAGGRIEVHSQLGQGSTFTVYIPQ